MKSILKRLPCVVESFKNSSRNNKELVFFQNKLQPNAHVSIVKGFVKKKSQFGAEGNELENALAKQWLEPIMNTKSKTAANKICSFLKEPAKAAFQNDSPVHTPSTCSKTVHLVAPWCCHRIEPLLWVAACDVFWVS